LFQNCNVTFVTLFEFYLQLDGGIRKSLNRVGKIVINPYLKMKTKKLLFRTAFVVSTALFILLGSCQMDDVNPVVQDPIILLGRSSQSDINIGKQYRKILFISKIDGADDEIYAMNADGSNMVRLTDNDVPDGRATWSANGQHIAFTSVGTGSKKDIFVMNANGQGLINLTNSTADEEWPEWSPSGNKIIFSSDRDANPAGKHEIYSINLDGTEITRLTYRTEDDKWPSYSPDGSKIVCHPLIYL